MEGTGPNAKRLGTVGTLGTLMSFRGEFADFQSAIRVPRGTLIRGRKDEWKCAKKLGEPGGAEENAVNYCLFYHEKKWISLISIIGLIPFYALAKRAAHRDGWQSITYGCRGVEVTRAYKTFLATSHLMGGPLRVVLARIAHAG